MCHCGDYYCYLSYAEAKTMNELHNKLKADADWIAKFPDIVDRDQAILNHLGGRRWRGAGYPCGKQSQGNLGDCSCQGSGIR